MATIEHLEKLVYSQATTIAYLERTVASLQEQAAKMSAALDRLREFLERPEFYGDWESRARYHENQAKFFRDIQESVAARGESDEAKLARAIQNLAEKKKAE